MMPHERKVSVYNGKLVGNTKYHMIDLTEIPFKYLKWLAHSSICDQKVRDYYLTIRPEDLQTSVCIYCNEEKKKSEMVPAQESWHIPGIYHNSNICQDCNDKKLAIHSAKTISARLGKEITDEEVSEDFINAKVQVTRLRRSINQRTK